MSSCVDVIGRDIAQPFVITPVVIVFDEGPDCFLQLTRHIVRHLVNFPFYGAMVSFNLAVGLRMKGRGSDVPYPHQMQVLVESLRNVARPVIRQQHHHQALDYRTPAEAFNSTLIERINGGMVESLTSQTLRMRDPLLILSLPCLNNGAHLKSGVVHEECLAGVAFKLAEEP